MLWYTAIRYLVQISKTNKSLCKIAESSPQRISSSITCLETIDQSTWSLSASSKFELTEWILTSTADDHGLHRTYKIEPIRSIPIDMSRFPSRLQNVQGVIQVAPNILWITTGNSIATLDLSSSNTQLVWPDNNNEQQFHTDAIRLMTLVSSVSGYELWTYDNQGDIYIWQTPSIDDAHSNNIHPIFLHKMNISERLSCIKQIAPTQVWAGAEDGTIIGWDIASRSLLPEPLLNASMKHNRPVTALLSLSKHSIVFSGSHDQSLRKFTLPL